MATFRVEEGRIIREKDGRQQKDELLRTKIVATLGSPHSYDGGLFDLNEKQVNNLSYRYLVGEFYKNGVDVIRLNLSHPEVDEIEETFLEIKSAILECERQCGNRKRIALLADLPGPKIRFHLTVPVTFKVGQEFTVHFEDECCTDGGATVFVDNQALKKALSNLYRPQGRFRSNAIPEIVENVLGKEFINQEGESDPYQVMLNEIRKKLNSNQRVLAVVGDGDVFMKVNNIDQTNSALNCTVVTVKGGKEKKTDKEEAPSMAVGEIKIKGNKGFTLKGIDMDISSFTNEDRKKLDKLLDAEYKEFGNEGWEPVVAFIALSFVQSADDISKIKEYIERKLYKYISRPDDARLQSPSVIAKIETNKGWENRHFILDVADGIMVARGDLGIQMDIQDVPDIQKKLILLCNKRGKPVITATEMLKSMTDSIEPTRAEVTDVFNAILDGSDAVMLSEETAKGKYPFHAIQKMTSIAIQAERNFERLELKEKLRSKANMLRIQEFLKDDSKRIRQNTGRFRDIQAAVDEGEVSISNSFMSDDKKNELQIKLGWRKGLYREKWLKSVQQLTTNRITQATCIMSESEDVKFIIAATTSGRTVRMISRLRPSVTIIGAAHDIINTRKLAISYGVLPICIGKVDEDEGTEGIFIRCRDEISKDEIIKDAYLPLFLGEMFTVIFTAGTRLGKSGTTDLIQMRQIIPH
jgi:pyruvate kinase